MSRQVNLLNPTLARRKLAFSALAMAQGLGVVMLGLAVTYVAVAYRGAQLERQSTALTERLKTEQARLEKITRELAPRQKNKLLEDEVKQLGAELAAREEVLATLRGSGAIGDTKGYSAYMRGFARQIVDGLWLTEFSIGAAGKEIAIGGRALEAELVPNYLKRLKREEVMQGRTFDRLEMHLPKAEIAGQGKATDVAGYIEFTLGSFEVAPKGEKSE